MANNHSTSSIPFMSCTVRSFTALKRYELATNKVLLDWFPNCILTKGPFMIVTRGNNRFM